MNVAKMRAAGVIGVAALGAVVSTALAGPASAELAAGAYTRSIGAMPSNVTVTACGPDCLFLQTSGTVAFELRRQGAVWTGNYMLSGRSCSVSVDNVSLVETDTCGDQTITLQLAPAG
jgi:hypothetical protein